MSAGDSALLLTKFDQKVQFVSLGHLYYFNFRFSQFYNFNNLCISCIDEIVKVFKADEPKVNLSDFNVDMSEVLEETFEATLLP